MDLQKLLKIIAIAIGVISIIFLVNIIATGNDAIKAGQSESSVGIYMYLSYFVLTAAIMSVVIFTASNFISNAASSKNTLISITVFISLTLICYFFASGDETLLKDGSVLSTSQSKMVGAGLSLFYILAFIAAGIMLFFGIKKSINK